MNGEGEHRKQNGYEHSFTTRRSSDLIGGVSDMIEHKKNGLLLPKSFSTIMLSNALQKSFFFKDNLVRENAYKMFLEKYDANKNYPEFINKIELLGTKHSTIGDKVEEH